MRRSLTLAETATLLASLLAALLVLTPVVHGARGNAERQLCAARLGSLAQQNAVYLEESNGWFFGSPVTTGQEMWREGATDPSPADDPMLDNLVQIWDWAGPIARRTMTLDPNPAIRWRDQLIEGAFACPSNNFISVPYPAPAGDFQPQKMVSYNSQRAMMTRGGTAPAGSESKVYLQYFHPQMGGSVNVPATYAPQLDLVGNPARKIFLADGARYTRDSGGIETWHDISWMPSGGGAFSSGAPTDPDAFQSSYHRSAYSPEMAARAYRHPCGPFLGLNAAYFDGHVDWMSEALSRFPDFWWPTGTIIPRAEMNQETYVLTRPYLDAQSRYHVR
jgi:hypothetical protein